MKDYIIIRPILTEKINRLSVRTNNTQYAFVVRKDANKIEIKQAIERKFQVDVESVRTVIVAPTRRRRYSKSGVLEGKTASYKKAYITIREGQEINFYESV